MIFKKNEAQTTSTLISQPSIRFHELKYFKGGELIIDPVTRLEGHLAIRLEVEKGRVKAAYGKGEMYRGFETILAGRDPLDAQQIVQRICGICPVSHGIASVKAQEEAYGTIPPENARIMRDIMLAANYLQSHITHFYHLSAPDFIDIKAVLNYTGKEPVLLEFRDWLKKRLKDGASGTIYPAAPFLPRYEGEYIRDTGFNQLAVLHYIEALEIRALCHKMGAVFAGRLPHASTLVPGGVTEKVTAKKIASCRSMLMKIRRFIDTAYLPDAVGAASAFPSFFRSGKGPGNYMAYGVFPDAGKNTGLFPRGVLIDGVFSYPDEKKIEEGIRYSYFEKGSGKNPDETVPAPDKPDAYSWVKAPRYDDSVMEVGPLARIMVACALNIEAVKKPVDEFLRQKGLKPESLDSLMGRHAARALEAGIIAEKCCEWLDLLDPGKPVCKDFHIPREGKGAGWTEAPRGALLHRIEIENHKIARYLCMVPSTWNCSPRDDKKRPGAMEQALVGTPVADPENPLEAVRVVRSFDPCLACAVH